MTSNVLSSLHLRWIPPPSSNPSRNGPTPHAIGSTQTSSRTTHTSPRMCRPLDHYPSVPRTTPRRNPTHVSSQSASLIPRMHTNTSTHQILHAHVNDPERPDTMHPLIHPKSVLPTIAFPRASAAHAMVQYLHRVTHPLRARAPINHAGQPNPFAHHPPIKTCCPPHRPGCPQGRIRDKKNPQRHSEHPQTRKRTTRPIATTSVTMSSGLLNSTPTAFLRNPCRHPPETDCTPMQDGCIRCRMRATRQYLAWIGPSKTHTIENIRRPNAISNDPPHPPGRCVRPRDLVKTNAHAYGRLILATQQEDPASSLVVVCRSTRYRNRYTASPGNTTQR